MADEPKFVPDSTLKTGPEIPSSGCEVGALENELSVLPKAENGENVGEGAAAEAEPETGCPVRMGLLAHQRCGRQLHSAPDGIDRQPVCLMHSNDERKQSWPLFEEFRSNFERILEDAKDGLAHFEYFVFPRLELEGRTIKAMCRFVEATFSQDAVFLRSIFIQDADFRGTTFMQIANFSRTTFNGKANFTGATFARDASLHDATFVQNADFYGSHFMQYANFRRGTFKQDAYFLRATFAQNADFGRATFTQNAGFEGTKFYGVADWRECRFLGEVAFRRTAFKPDGEGRPSGVFSLAKFAKPEDVVFDDVDLTRAIFLNCDVSKVWFTSSVRWSNRKGNHGNKVFEEEILLDPRLSELRLDFGPMDHGAVEQIYHQLKKNYDARLDYRQANVFHFGEMEMRRLEARAYPTLLKPWGGLRPWLGPEAFYRWASDYGNSYVKPMLWLLGLLLLFAALFPIPGLEFKPKAAPEATYASLWNKQDTWSNNIWTEAKLLGESAIAAVDTATFQKNPEYVPAYPWGRVLAIVETLLTSTLFGLFLLAIRRQFKR
jgi:uncharacterized protein YjbI with pentapeptide repeats